MYVPPKIVPKVPLYTKRAKVAVQALKAEVFSVFLTASPKLDIWTKRRGHMSFQNMQKHEVLSPCWGEIPFRPTASGPNRYIIRNSGVGKRAQGPL